MAASSEAPLLSDAARHPRLSNSIKDYFELRRLFGEGKHDEFRQRFSTYYKLRWVTEQWKTRYFERLREFKQAKYDEPYQSLLFELYDLPRQKKGEILEFSFVSKLVAFHDESRPIFDSRVRKFFGIGPPRCGTPEFRVSGFVKNLDEIARRYGAWTRDKEIAAIIEGVRSQHPELAATHHVRVCDFLVYRAGAD